MTSPIDRYPTAGRSCRRARGRGRGSRRRGRGRLRRAGARRRAAWRPSRHSGVGGVRRERRPAPTTRRAPAACRRRASRSRRPRGSRPARTAPSAARRRSRSGGRGPPATRRRAAGRRPGAAQRSRCRSAPAVGIARLSPTPPSSPVTTAARNSSPATASTAKAAAWSAEAGPPCTWNRVQASTLTPVAASVATVVMTRSRPGATTTNRRPGSTTSATVATPRTMPREQERAVERARGSCFGGRHARIIRRPSGAGGSRLLAQADVLVVAGPVGEVGEDPVQPGRQALGAPVVVVLRPGPPERRAGVRVAAGAVSSAGVPAHDPRLPLRLNIGVP